MSLILVYFILLNGRTTEREGEDMREGSDMYYLRLCQNSRPFCHYSRRSEVRNNMAYLYYQIPN